jgi:hypothetical protein
MGFGKMGSLTDTLYIASIVDEMARMNDDVTAATRAAEASLEVPPA